MYDAVRVDGLCRRVVDGWLSGKISSPHGIGRYGDKTIRSATALYGLVIVEVERRACSSG